MFYLGTFLNKILFGRTVLECYVFTALLNSLHWLPVSTECNTRFRLTSSTSKHLSHLTCAQSHKTLALISQKLYQQSDNEVNIHMHITVHLPGFFCPLSWDTEILWSASIFTTQLVHQQVQECLYSFEVVSLKGLELDGKLCSLFYV